MKYGAMALFITVSCMAMDSSSYGQQMRSPRAITNVSTDEFSALEKALINYKYELQNMSYIVQKCKIISAQKGSVSKDDFSLFRQMEAMKRINDLLVELAQNVPKTTPEERTSGSITPSPAGSPIQPSLLDTEKFNSIQPNPKPLRSSSKGHKLLPDTDDQVEAQSRCLMNPLSHSGKYWLPELPFN